MVPSSQWWAPRLRFRDLFDEALSYRGKRLAEEILLPWVEANPEAVEALHEIGQPESHQVRVIQRPGHYSFAEMLYPLGRLLDFLSGPMQPASEEPLSTSLDRLWPPWSGFWPAPEDLAAFMAALGCSRIVEPVFHPFFHEVVAVESASDPGQQPVLVTELWPGHLAGSMLLLRAGVVVRAGADHLHPDVVARSCLYWTWTRRNRLTSDLSHGWGHNSQWGTELRRDYIVGDELHYNVDARYRPHRADDEYLREEAKAELVRYRCSTTLDLGPDVWVWNDHLVERR